MGTGKSCKGVFRIRLTLGLLLCGCSTVTELPSAGSTGAGGSSSSGALLPPSTMPPSPSTTTDMPSVDSSSSTAAIDEPECSGGFLDSSCLPDVPHIEMCNVWDNDCPRGEKCNIWANDGGSTWNATRCVPLAPDPAGPDEPCTVQDFSVSGFDDCDVGAVCIVSDADSLEGECMPMCVGSPRAPTCDDLARICTVGGSSIPAFCRPRCNPLDADACFEGSGCYAIEDGYTDCEPDASGPDSGAALDPCEFSNACDPGLLCLDAQSVGACPEDAADCCTPWCDLTEPECPENTACVPAYPRGDAPTGQDNVGYCGQPPT